MYYQEPKKRGYLSYIVVALIAALIGGVLSPFIANNFLYGKILPNPNETKVEQTGTNLSSEKSNISINPNDDVNTVSAVAEKAMPSVVGVTTVQIKQDMFLRPVAAQGVGSGIIVDPNGYILTNSHVIANGNAEEIKVLFENGDEKEAQLLWYDSTLDLAVIKVEGTNFKTADLGDSDNLTVGELAVAIGNPLGLEYQRTVTSGVVSGLNRTVDIREANGTKTMENLIQTDAAINEGNSGGPLLNSKGEVIGINTVKLASTGVEGFGFAVPINQAKMIIDSIIKTGKYEPVMLGVGNFVEVGTYERLTGVKLPSEYGIVIGEVIDGYAAQKAGIQTGDIITKIDGEEIKTVNELRYKIYNYKEGDKAKINLIRDMKEMEIEVTFITPNKSF